MSSAGSDNYLLLNRLAEEFADRYRRGERPSLQEYIDRHPELAADIREFFPAMADMEQAKEDREQAGGQPAAPSLTPQQLGDFRILREVGKGGMGVVYEAEQVSLGRHVALKVLPRNLLPDARAKRRFEREARSAAKLHHTNIVPVFGVGEQDGMPYYVMQFIQGLGLDEVLEELKKLQLANAKTGSFTGGELRLSRKEISAGQVARSLLTGAFQRTSDIDDAYLAATPEAAVPGDAQAAATPSPPALSDSFAPSSSSVVLPGQSRDTSKTKGRKQTYWRSVASIGVQVAEALDYAHKQGVQHRDIKPSNLLLDTQGTVWVTDFGLAKADDKQNLTHTGDILGTLRYMPPEAFEGKTDARSDVYSLGLTLYEMLAFRPAFGEKERNRLIKQVTQEEPARLGKLNRQVPQDLETIVHKAIDKDPRRRYASAKALSEDLQRFIDDEPIQARRVSRAERCWRWCRHNPALAAETTAAALLLITVAVVSTVSAFRIDAARDEAVEAKKLAEGNAEESRQRLVQAQVAGGASLVEQGDLHGALPWFAEALRLDQGDPAREENHRLRLAATFQRSAKLVALWSTPPGVGRAAVCPDGHRVALSGSGGLQVWDGASGRLRFTVAKGSVVKDFAFSPDGGRVATAGENGNARVWDLETGRPVTPPLRHDGPVNRVAFSPGAGRLVTASDDKTAGLWDAATGERLNSFRPHNDAVQCASFSPDGKRVVTRSGGMIHVWEAAGGKAVTWFYADIGQVLQDAVFSPDGQSILVTGGQRIVRSWDADTGQFRSMIPHHGSAWLSADRNRAVSARGLVSESSDKSAQVWDLRTRQPVTPPLPQTRGTVEATFSPQGDRLATTGPDGTVRVWDIETGEVVAGLLRHAAAVTSAAFSPDGRLLVTRDEAGLVRVWDLAGSAAPDSPLKPSISGADRWFSPDGKWALSTTPVGVAWLWDARTGRLVRAVHEPGWVTSAAITPDGGRLLTGHATGVARVWQATTGVPIGAPLRHKGVITHVEFSPDGRLVATAGVDRSAGVWDAATGKLVAEMKHAQAVRWATFSADGRRLVTAAGDRSYSGTGRPRDLRDPASDPSKSGAAQVWDAATGRPVTRPIPHEGVVRRASFSPDGRYILTTCVSRTGNRNHVQVWDAATGSRVTDAMVHPQGVIHEAFSPDGRLVATGCADGAARVWDVVTGKARGFLAKHGGPVRWVGFGPGAARLVTASEDGTARVWDATTGQLIALLRHARGVQSAVFATDGYSVITGCEDLSVRVWPLAPDNHPVGDWVALAEVMAGGSRSRVPAALPSGTGREEDWTATLQTLRAKYLADFATSKAEQLAWHRAALEIASTKQAWPAALAHLGRLLDIDPADWRSRLARARLLVRLDRWDEAEAECNRAVQRHPKVAQTWVARGSFALGRGRRDKAAADFARAIDLGTPELSAALSEFWVAGLYPKDFPAPFPPEKQTDPAQAIPTRPGRKVNLRILARWRPESTDRSGYLDLAACFDQAEHVSAYALAYVYAKKEQEAVLLTGSDDELRLWLNGGLVYEYDDGRAPAPDQDRILVKLRAGWNVVLAKVLNRTGQHGLFLRLSADPQLLFAVKHPREGELKQLDRSIEEARGTAAEVKLLLSRGVLRGRRGWWKRAAEDYARAIKLDPDAHDAWYELAAVRLRLGDLDAFRRHCQDMLRRFGRMTDPYKAERTAKACLIVPDTVADVKQLVRLTEQALRGTENEWGHPWFLLSRGIAEYRAGRPRPAIGWIEKARKRFPGPASPVYGTLGQLFLAMAYHRLNEPDKARAALREASEIMDRRLPKADSGDLGEFWLDWVFCQTVRREAQALIGAAAGSKKPDSP
jgi:WD40 repeat protein/serine/threonine protein kinase/tetratricopeptide (TPR) repeat protein